MGERTLSRLGLNQYERKVYLHLVEYGISGAVELAKKSGVPYGRIYDVLYQLEAKGFVKVVLGKPKQFAPIKPGIALDSAVKKLREAYDEIETEAKKDREELEKQFLLQKEAKNPIIWMVSGEKNVRETRRRELTEAQRELNAIVSPDVSTGRDPVIERIAREAEERGVTRRFIENPKTESDWQKIKDKKEGGAQIRFHQFRGFTLSIIDRKLVRIEVKDHLYGRSSVFIENENLAEALNEFFIVKWKNSKARE